MNPGQIKKVRGVSALGLGAWHGMACQAACHWHGASHATPPLEKSHGMPSIT